MILPYYMRLLCLCCATFFVVHGMVWLVVRAVGPTVVKVAGTMRARSASRLLFTVRMAPAAVTAFLVAAFCVPSYIWLEPDITAERVGVACLLAAAMGAAVWAVSLLRGVTSMVRTELYVRQRSRGMPAGESGPDGLEVLLVSSDAAIMALAGVALPRLVVSRKVMDVLDDEPREVAFRHEAAHRASRDNLKRLLFLLSPDVLPFVRGLSCLERTWAKCTEWAADDEAVDGSQERALWLALALVRVAKLGVNQAPAYLLSSLIEDDRDLEDRVDRLLGDPAGAEKPLQPVAALPRVAVLVIAGVTATLLLWPQSLGGVHRLLEHLVR